MPTSRLDLGGGFLPATVTTAHTWSANQTFSAVPGITLGTSEATLLSTTVCPITAYKAGELYFLIRNTTNDIETFIGAGGSVGLLGTSSNHPLDLYANNVLRMTILTASQTVEIKNGTAAQELRVYGTTTGPRYISLKHDGTNATLDLVGGGAVDLAGETLANVGPATPSGNNSNDLGSAALNFRTGYFGTAVTVGTNPADAGAVRIQNAQPLNWRNAANNGNITFGYVNGSNQIILGESATIPVKIANHASTTFSIFAAPAVGQGAAIADADGTLADVTAKYNTLKNKLKDFGFFAV